jgi:predicted nucleotidyltransferase
VTLTFDDYLQSRGLVETEIIESVRAHIHLLPGEAIFASGSIVEGLGNLYSDLDLFVVTDRDVSALQAGPAIVLLSRETPIDIEVLSPEDIHRSVQRVCSVYDKLDDPRHALGLTLKELDMLHRLSIGRPLVHPDVCAGYQELVPTAHLARILFARAQSLINSLQQDIVGHIWAGDGDSARLIAQRLAGAAFDCLLATFGNTNPSEKWRLSKLTTLPARDVESLLNGTPFGSLRDTALFFLTFMGACDSVEYCFEAVRLANALLPWCQYRLRGQTMDSRIPISLERPASTRSLPSLDLLAQIRYEDDALCLSHIRRPINLLFNPLAHNLLLSFDGKTSPHEAATVLIRESTNVEEALSVVDDVTRVLATYGLLNEKVTD